MELRKFKDKRLANFTIVNYSGNTSSGFYHDSTLMVNNNEIEHNRCNYLNRTWEHYPYQTSMFAVIRAAKNHWKNYYLLKFKVEKGYSNLSSKRREEFEKYLKEQKEIIVYDLMYKEVELYHC